MMEKQLKLEKEAYDYSYDRMIREIAKRIDAGQADELSEGKLILKLSLDAVTTKLEEYFTMSLKGKKHKYREYYADYYGKPQELAFILLMCIVQTISKDPFVKISVLAKHINTTLYHNELLSKLKRDYSRLDAYVDKVYKRRSKSSRKSQKIRIAKEKEKLNGSLSPDTIKAAASLIEVVLKSGANIIEKKLIYDKGKSYSVIMYTDLCFQMITQSREILLSSYKKYPIFVVPPKPWSDYKGTGGYYTEELYKLNLIKARGYNNKLLADYFRKAPHKVTTLYEIVNTLQQTSWRINKKIYEVSSKIFYENVVDYSSPRTQPYLIGGLPYNEHLEADDFLDMTTYGELHTDGYLKGKPKDGVMYSKYLQDYEKQYSIIAGIMGKNIATDLALTDAKKYLEEPHIYFSYQYDFRGRIYPIQQHLHPQGNEIMKALLEFSNGCRIETDEQLEWFLIHGANCYGFDKDEYENRVSKIKEKEHEILEIAKDPIRNREYWKDADSPFLYLAWCLEYAEYLRSPLTFISHLPIGLDATCSGIQIYSGLLKDRDGASAVNVIGNKREDIYQRVADKVNHYLLTGDYPKEIEYTTADKQKHIVDTNLVAQELAGRITRKFTKRNTMTQPYSVTKFGMYQQLLEELDSMEAVGDKFWTSDNWVVAKLLTQLNDRAIVETVKGARIGQEFLKEVTSDLVKQGKYVFYTTPFIGFPVLQKIQRVHNLRVSTEVGKLTIHQETNEIHEIKMVNGIAPNFVHSLDGSLLQMTMLKLKEDGCVSFHFIHDQYGVPINHVPNLNTRVREAYIELFESNPLERWLNQVYKGYPKSANEVIIGDLDLKEVASSRYIFS